MGDTDILGILSIIFAILFAPVGFVLGIIGIVRNRKRGTKITLPLIGLIVSVLPLILMLMFIGIGSIAYFGVLNPESFIPERCQIGPGAFCDDYSYDAQADTFEFQISNGFGRTIEVQSLTVSGPDIIGACTTNTSSTIRNGERATFTVPDCGSPSEDVRGTITLTYVFENGIATPKTLTGEVYVTR